MRRLFGLALVIAACGGQGGGPADADVSDGPPPDVPLVALTLDAGDGATLVVQNDGEVRLERDGVVLVSLERDGFEVGTVPSLDPSLNYDPYFLEDVEPVMYRPPAGLEWEHPRAADVAERGEGLALDLDYGDGRTSTLETAVSAEGRFSASWSLPGGERVPVFARLVFRVDPEERFYGLGEHFDHVEHRGRVRAMQIEPAPLEGANNEAHVPIPLLIGTSGWGLYVDSRRPGVFAVGTDEDDVVRVTYGLGAASAEGLRFFLVAEGHPLDVTRHFHEVTGQFGEVAPWALGPLIWRDEVAGQAEVEDDLRTIRDLDLATTGYWIDRPYASGVNSFDFDPELYSDPAAMISLAHDLGFRMSLWHTPYVDEEDDATRPLYDHALAEGFFPPQRSTAAARWGPPIDFTNPEAVAWWQDLLGAYRDLGVEGYKLDYAEEVLVGAFGIRLPWSFHDGTDELTMHGGYQVGYHRAYAEMLPGDGGFLLCRASVAGDQVHGPIIWPGDIDASFARLGDAVVDEAGEEYTAVGGLPAAVVAGSSLGPSGFPLFGSDTGGYRHAPPDRETYIRWFEHTALSTVMQVGTGSNDLPWDLGDTGLDEEVLELYRVYARLHLRLFPYLWTYLMRVRDDGRAVQRPLGLAHPELGEHPDDIYLLGDHLLVAPVVDRGVTTRDVPFPVGTWQDWWTGVAYEGRVSVPAPLETLPLFVRLWTPVPMLRPTIDTLSPVADPAEIDSFDTRHDPLWVRVAVAAEVDAPQTVELALYDGTALSVVAEPGAGGCVAIVVERTPGTVFAAALVFELVGAALREAAHAPSRMAAETAIDEASDAAAFEESDAAWLETEPGRALVKVPVGSNVLSATVCGP
jgi:alpha-D-xyloside xylohydrolase